MVSFWWRARLFQRWRSTLSGAAERPNVRRRGVRESRLVSVANFDRAGGLLLAFTFGFSAGVALADWSWFPSGDWGDVAHIPATPLNYVALLLPWVLLLIFLLLRRRCFGKQI